VPEVIVAIPTFRRPQGLEKLLLSLAAQETERRVGVVVADNDAIAHEGFDLCARLSAEGYRWPLKTFVVADRGLAQVRNALVSAAMYDPETRFVAMLDDDEWSEPGWLNALMNVQENTGADVVRGAVLRVFEIDPPRWALHWEGIAHILSASEHEGPIEGAGNVLIARRCFEALEPPFFDPQFGLTGGEDRDFFLRLYAGGNRFARAGAAIVHEFVPSARLRLSWSLMRAYRTGNSDLRMVLKYKRNATGIAREIAKILAAFASVPVLTLLYSLTPSHRLDGIQKLFRAAGKVGALVGHRYYEYAAQRYR
jgi:glycosyltransferase involved in cell wall biosynthesis